jgi:hypothetical protein
MVGYIYHPEGEDPDPDDPCDLQYVWLKQVIAASKTASTSDTSTTYTWDAGTIEGPAYTTQESSTALSRSETSTYDQCFDAAVVGADLCEYDGTTATVTRICNFSGTVSTIERMGWYDGTAYHTPVIQQIDVSYTTEGDGSTCKWIREVRTQTWDKFGAPTGDSTVTYPAQSGPTPDYFGDPVITYEDKADYATFKSAARAWLYGHQEIIEDPDADCDNNAGCAATEGVTCIPWPKVARTIFDYRWMVPDSHLGSYYRIEWDEVFYPTSGAQVVTNKAWEWSGATGGPPPDTHRWSDWALTVSVPENNTGTVEIRNVKVKCYRDSGYGEKFQIINSYGIYTPPTP